MTPTWENYQPYVPVAAKPHHEMTKQEAKGEYDSFMSQREARWLQIRSLMSQDGKILETTDEGIQNLYDWFRENVEINPTNPERLTNLTYALINDIAIILGDVMTSRNPTLHWEFWNKPPRSDVAFQKPVITGYTKVPNKKYHVDPIRLVATCAYRVAEGLPQSPTFFLDVLHSTQKKA